MANDNVKISVELLTSLAEKKLDLLSKRLKAIGVTSRNDFGDVINGELDEIAVKSLKSVQGVDKIADAFIRVRKELERLQRVQNSGGRGRGRGGGGGGFMGGGSRFSRGAMVAGGALTGLTGNMQFLGPGFAAMSGGGPGAALVGVATAMGAAVRAGVALEDRIIALSASFEDFGGVLGDRLKQIHEQNEAMSLGRDIAGMRALGDEGARKQRVGGGILLDAIGGGALQGLARLADVALGGKLTAMAEKAEEEGKAALQASRIRAEKTQLRDLMKTLNAPEQTPLQKNIEALEKGLKFPDLQREISNTIQHIKDLAAATELEAKQKEIASDRIKTFTREITITRRLRKGAESVRASVDEDFATQLRAKELARLVKGGGLDIDIAAKSLAKKPKDFRSSFVGIEEMSRKIQTATLSRKGEPTKEDITNMRDMITKEVSLVGDIMKDDSPKAMAEEMARLIYPSGVFPQ